MMTVKQVAQLTGVSVRTLQFYDEIGLLKPARLTDAGYRLYDYHELEVLQQILFFKELDFSLKEIKAIMENPQFDQTQTLKKQRELIQVKRDRLNALLQLLDKLIKGEKCMEFKDFDMSGYFRMLDEFRNTQADKIVERFGSVEFFDKMISQMKSNEYEIAEKAIRQYGSIEKYIHAREESVRHFLDEGCAVSQTEVDELLGQSDAVTRKLTADLQKDPASAEIQEIVGELISFVNKCNNGIDMGENYWSIIAEGYRSNADMIEITDKKYGAGASAFIGLALKVYLGEA